MWSPRINLHVRPCEDKANITLDFPAHASPVPSRHKQSHCFWTNFNRHFVHQVHKFRPLTNPWGFGSSHYKSQGEVPKIPTRRHWPEISCNPTKSQQTKNNGGLLVAVERKSEEKFKLARKSSSVNQERWDFPINTDLRIVIFWFPPNSNWPLLLFS